MLIFRFERHQYMDVRKLWDNAEENAQYKNVCDVYGAEHLARLIGSYTSVAMYLSSGHWLTRGSIYSFIT